MKEIFYITFYDHRRKEYHRYKLSANNRREAENKGRTILHLLPWVKGIPSCLVESEKEYKERVNIFSFFPGVFQDDIIE